MVKTVEKAVKMNFQVEILSNCYWATCLDDAVEWLVPIAKLENVKLSLSSDFFTANWVSNEIKNAVKAANTLNMTVGVIAVKYPEAKTACPGEIEGVRVDLLELMYRGRAYSKLIEKAEKNLGRNLRNALTRILINKKGCMWIL